jgi:hypothetical protein
LMVALTLLAIVSIAGLQIMQMSQSSFSAGRSSLATQQKNQAITAFINQDFGAGMLPETAAPQPYVNPAMPTDLRSGDGLTLATVFGNASRFDVTAPKCILTTAAKPEQRQVTFRADCHSIAGQTLAAAINRVLATGARISFAIDGAGAKCSALTPIENNALGQTAILQVEDATCLTLSSNAAIPAPAGSHILLPRFVAYDAARPDRFHHTGFSAGALGPTNCAAGGADRQPQLSVETNRLAVFGGTGAGQWFAVKDNFLSWRGNDIDSICGYYVEWGGMPGDPDVITALTETINIAAHRRHCRID